MRGEILLYFHHCISVIVNGLRAIHTTSTFLISFFLRFLFIFSTEIETASKRGNTSTGSGRGSSRLIAEEPDVGLDPIRAGSHPEPKADA